MYVYVCMCMYMYMYVYVYVYMYMYIYVYMYVCIDSCKDRYARNDNLFTSLIHHIDWFWLSFTTVSQFLSVCPIYPISVLVTKPHCLASKKLLPQPAKAGMQEPQSMKWRGAECPVTSEQMVFVFVIKVSNNSLLTHAHIKYAKKTTYRYTVYTPEQKTYATWHIEVSPYQQL